MDVLLIVLILVTIITFIAGCFYIVNDTKKHAVASWIFSGLTFLFSIITFYYEDEIKSIDSTTTTTLIEEKTSTTIPIETTTTTTIPTTTTTEATTYQNKDNYIASQDNLIIGHISSESKELHQTYSPPKTGRYRLDFEISNVENNYYVIIKNSTGEEVDSAYFSDEGMTIKELKKNEKYTIIVTASYFDEPFDFSIKINLPDN